jgi:DNA adenine methylase
VATRLPDVADVGPLLKWAGGKRQLLPALRRHYPSRFTTYIEPFFGSGAVFFDLYRSGRLDGRRARLADFNADLIGCYRTVCASTEKVVAALSTLAQQHAKRGDFYYDVRDLRFNPERERLAQFGRLVDYTPELAAMMIYLNRTGYNGLFRLNGKGRFNVPAGRYAAPRICDANQVFRFARALMAPGVTLEHARFEEILVSAGAGDFIYCDPPYAPLSHTARFTSYTANGFSLADQTRLQKCVLEAAGRGALVLLSNSSSADIVRLYSSPRARALGFALHRVPARRAISSKHTTRGPVSELIVTNTADARLAIQPRMARLSLESANRRRHA